MPVSLDPSFADPQEHGAQCGRGVLLKGVEHGDSKRLARLRKSAVGKPRRFVDHARPPFAAPKAAARDEAVRLEDAEVADHCRAREAQGGHKILDGLATPDAHQFNDMAPRLLHHLCTAVFYHDAKKAQIYQSTAATFLQSTGGRRLSC